MEPTNDQALTPGTDQRAADQGEAQGAAFAAGTLPEADRRAPDPAPTPDISPAAGSSEAEDEGTAADDLDDANLIVSDPDSAAKQLVAFVGAAAAHAFALAVVRQTATTPAPDAALVAIADEPVAPAVPTVLVEAIKEGHDGTQLRTIGERFRVEATKVGKWMKAIETDVVDEIKEIV